LSRIRILALFATVAALASLLAACGGSDRSSEDPQQVVESATLKGVESGELKMKLEVSSQGKEAGNLDVEVSGPFQQGAKGELPELAIQASAKGNAQGEPVDFEGGLTLLSDRAFVEYEGQEYEVDPTTFGFVRSAFERAQQQGGAESGDVTACQQAAEGIGFSQFFENAENEGSADVEGTSTTKVSGDLDVSGAVDALIKLTEDPACAKQLEAAGKLPLGELEAAKGELSSAIKKAHVELYVGDDDIVRKFAAELTVEPKGSHESVEVDLEVSLAKVNESQSISAPSGAQPLERLFLKLGINPIELLEGGASGGIGNLIEKLGGASLGGGGSAGTPGGGSSGGEASPGSGSQAEYVECLSEAQSAADIQKCANLLK
jgi:hypothetical protein